MARSFGAVAQLVAHRTGSAGVTGSNPSAPPSRSIGTPPRWLSCDFAARQGFRKRGVLPLVLGRDLVGTVAAVGVTGTARVVFVRGVACLSGLAVAGHQVDHRQEAVGAEAGTGRAHTIEHVESGELLDVLLLPFRRR